MKYALLILVALMACDDSPEDIAKHRFAGEAYCHTIKGGMSAVCSFNGRNYICFTYQTSIESSALCLEAVDPFDVVQGKSKAVEATKPCADTTKSAGANEFRHYGVYVNAPGTLGE